MRIPKCCPSCKSEKLKTITGTVNVKVFINSRKQDSEDSHPLPRLLICEKCNNYLSKIMDCKQCGKRRDVNTYGYCFDCLTTNSIKKQQKNESPVYENCESCGQQHWIGNNCSNKSDTDGIPTTAE